MDEPLNEYDGPNPLEQLAEKVRILVEKGEMAIAVQRLTAPGVEDLRRYAKGAEPRESRKNSKDRNARIERAILKNPKWSDRDLAKLLRVGKTQVVQVRREMNERRD